MAMESMFGPLSMTEKYERTKAADTKGLENADQTLRTQLAFQRAAAAETQLSENERKELKGQGWTGGDPSDDLEVYIFGRYMIPNGLRCFKIFDSYARLFPPSWLAFPGALESEHVAREAAEKELQDCKAQLAEATQSCLARRTHEKSIIIYSRSKLLVSKHLTGMFSIFM